MKKTIIYILFIALSFQAIANTEIWKDSANNLFQNKDYNAALENYQKIEQQDLESASLYYNIGNCYYKLKDYTSAVWYYEKALKLAPGDEDIKHNINITNVKFVDKYETMPVFFLKRWIVLFHNLFSSNTWAIISIVLFAVALLCFVYFRLGKLLNLRKTSFVLSMICLFLFAFSVYSAQRQYTHQKNQEYAIVFTPSLTAKSSPSETGTDIVVIHEGLKVKVLETLNEWTKIQIPDGNKAWIKSENIRGI